MNIYSQKYCVYHTTYLGDKMPPNYIGSTSVEKINNGYHGSVASKKYKTIWKSELKSHPELFHTVITSLHDTRQDALWKEMKIQQLFNVVKNPLFINESYASKDDFFGIDNSQEYSLISPDGILFTGTNAFEFCKEKGLNNGHIYQVMIGKEKHYKGWTSSDPEIISFWKQESIKRKTNRISKLANTLSKEFCVVDPMGKIHTGRNLTEFCIEYGLSRPNLHKVFNGERPHHKGWTKLCPQATII